MVYNPQKELLPCNIYSSQDNDILDKLLEERVNKAGYKTRAAAVAAARFLTLDFCNPRWRDRRGLTDCS